MKIEILITTTAIAIASYFAITLSDDYKQQETVLIKAGNWQQMIIDTQQELKK